MKTKKVLKKMKDEVGNVLSSVADKAEFVAKLSKLKIEIAQKNVKINNSLKELGENVYNRKKDFMDDSRITTIIKGIEVIKQDIEDLKTKIEDIKLIQKDKGETQGELQHRREE